MKFMNVFVRNVLPHKTMWESVTSPMFIKNKCKKKKKKNTLVSYSVQDAPQSHTLIFFSPDQRKSNLGFWWIAIFNLAISSEYQHLW